MKDGIGAFLRPIYVSLIKKHTKTNLHVRETLNTVVKTPIIHASILKNWP